ncbi:unnamed protein product [Polarella glacialis]|uniref:Uncharacterized protein n=1 Tax=Polarella glacialis TaxID=89957 RepID=A0A813JAH8_POLGL|nr:unnamed protein product [Polarella glacialis]
MLHELLGAVSRSDSNCRTWRPSHTKASRIASVLALPFHEQVWVSLLLELSKWTSVDYTPELPGRPRNTKCDDEKQLFTANPGSAFKEATVDASVISSQRNMRYRMNRSLPWQPLFTHVHCSCGHCFVESGKSITNTVLQRGTIHPRSPNDLLEEAHVWHRPTTVRTSEASGKGSGHRSPLLNLPELILHELERQNDSQLQPRSDISWTRSQASGELSAGLPSTYVSEVFAVVVVVAAVAAVAAVVVVVGSHTCRFCCHRSTLMACLVDEQHHTLAVTSRVAHSLQLSSSVSSEVGHESSTRPDESMIGIQRTCRLPAHKTNAF